MRYSTALTMLVFPISQVYWEDVCACMCARTCMHAYVQSCLTLCDPMGCSPPGSSVHGILQAGIPEWAAISSSRRSSWPRKWTHISCLLHCTQILYHWAIREAPDFRFRYNAKIYDLAFCINQFRLLKLIQIRWPKNTEIYFVTILEAGSLRSGYQYDQVLVKALWLSHVCILVVTSHGLFPVPRGWRRRRGEVEGRKRRRRERALCC